LSAPGRADTPSRELDASVGRQDHTILPYAGSISRPRAVDRSQAHHPPCNPLRTKRCRVHRIPSQRIWRSGYAPVGWDDSRI